VISGKTRRGLPRRDKRRGARTVCPYNGGSGLWKGDPEEGYEEEEEGVGLGGGEGWNLRVEVECVDEA
jgi:hypothetical protein